jgi:hypothetical protein
MAGLQKPRREAGALFSHQIRVLGGPSGLFGLLVSDELVGSGDGGGDLAISDLGMPLEGL